MANRYWVGNGGNWTNTAHWSDTSGGAGGFSYPTLNDNAYFTNLSFTLANQIVSTAAATYCHDMDWSGVTNTPRLSLFTYCYIYGSLILEGMTTNAGFVLMSTSSEIIETNGVPISSTTFGGKGTWVLQDDLLSVTGISFGRGKLDFNDYNVTITSGNFACDSYGGYIDPYGTHILYMGSGTLNIGGTFPTSGNFLFTSGMNPVVTYGETSTLICKGIASLSGSFGVFYPGVDLYDVIISCPYTQYEFRIGAMGAMSLMGVASCHNLTITQTSSGTYLYQKRLAINLSANLTITGTLTLTGFSTSRRIFIYTSGYNNTPGDQVTITAVNVSLTNVDFLDIIGAGAAAPFTGTSIGDCGNNSGITGDTPVTKYWVGNGGNWSDTAHWSLSSGGAGGAALPLAQDTVRFDSNSFSSGSQTVNCDIPMLGGSIDWTGVTNNPIWKVYQDVSGDTERSFTMFGSLTLSAAMTVSQPCTSASYNYLIMNGRGATYLTTNGVNPCPSGYYARFVFSSGNGSITLLDDLTITTAYHASGTLEINNFNVTPSYFYVGSTSFFSSDYGNLFDATLNMGNGNWYLHNAGLYFYNTGYYGTLTVNCEGSTIIVNPLVAAAGSAQIHCRKTGIVLNNIIVNGTNTTTTNYNFDITESVDISGTVEMEMNNFTIQNPRVLVTFYSKTGVIRRYKVNGILTANGEATKLIYFRSSASTRRAYLSAGVVSLSYINVKDNYAEGAIPFYDYPGGVNSGNNVNWLFTAPPVGGVTGQVSWF